MPLDDQLVTMSEKQLWQAFVLQNLNFQVVFLSHCGQLPV